MCHLGSFSSFLVMSLLQGDTSLVDEAIKKVKNMLVKSVKTNKETYCKPK